MNLFASMILQSLIRLVIYINQFVVREDGFTASDSEREGIDNTVCTHDEVIKYVLYERCYYS